MMTSLLRSQREAREALRDCLHGIDPLSFEQVMRRLLYKSGYVSVEMVGKEYKGGRTPRGGQLSARSVTELSSSLTIAIAKQYRHAVSRRFVDELRGAMLRTGAEQGLLLSMSAFSKAAKEAAQESLLAPVTLIEGEELLDLLFAYRIGVEIEGGRWRLDRRYLAVLRGLGELRDADFRPTTN